VLGEGLRLLREEQTMNELNGRELLALGAAMGSNCIFCFPDTRPQNPYG
jgi:hypothetical protein